MRFHDIPVVSGPCVSIGVEVEVSKHLAEAGERKGDSIVVEHHMLVAIVKRVMTSVWGGGFDIDVAVARIKESFEDQPKPADGAPTGKTWGYVINEWLKEQDAANQCLVLADFAPERAQHLYWKVDSRLVRYAVQQKLGFIKLQAKIGFESALYGSGNRYADDKPSGNSPSENHKVFDLTKGEGFDALKSLGF